MKNHWKAESKQRNLNVPSWNFLLKSIEYHLGFFPPGINMPHTYSDIPIGYPQANPPRQTRAAPGRDEEAMTLALGAVHR